MFPKLIPKFTKADIQKMMADRMLRIDAAIVLRLRRVGETFVKNARENGQYNDITGNLRNSIGYVVLRDGVQLYQDFRRAAKVGKGSGKKDGVNAARDLAFEIAQNFPRGYVLIVVAGMEYAAAVESRGKDVLTASSIIAKNDLQNAIKSLSGKIQNLS